MDILAGDEDAGELLAKRGRAVSGENSGKDRFSPGP
jgi:hypothetical protein